MKTAILVDGDFFLGAIMLSSAPKKLGTRGKPPNISGNIASNIWTSKKISSTGFIFMTVHP